MLSGSVKISCHDVQASIIWKAALNTELQRPVRTTHFQSSFHIHRAHGQYAVRSRKDVSHLDIRVGLGQSPLYGLSSSFRSYVRKRKEESNLHIAGNGLPDYAFAADYELRKKLDSIPNFYSLCKKICATYASRQLQIINQTGLAVGPGQLPDVYKIGCDCARRLGIGIPNIYVVNNRDLNAYTIAVDDAEPLIVIYSGLYERFTPGELRTVIGHECGHIHNQHGVYNMMVQLLLQGGFGVLASGGISSVLLSPALLGAQVALNSWSRAEEVTCDRAGMICCERVDDAHTAEAKFLYGAALGEHTIDFDELEKQLEMQRENITRLEELVRSHPTTIRRIMAEKAFAECELFYQWRPDLKQPGQVLRSKDAVDELCRKYINVVKK